MRLIDGKVWFNNELAEKDLLIENGKITKISTRITESEDGEQETISAKKLIVFPGLIDLHVHLREPGFDYKEDFKTGSNAAVAGGLTHVFDMPNNKIPITTAKLLREKIELANKKAKCKIGFYLGAAKGNESEWKKIADEKQFNGLKIYLGQTTGNLLLENEKNLEEHFSNFDQVRPIVVHAEDERKGGAAIPAIETSVKLAKKYKKKIHIAHISSAEEAVIAKKTYEKTTVETCPHYLFINEKELDKLGFKAGVNPPVRNNETREELWKELVAGKIDCISTDHAPHTLEDKKNGAKGYPGLETSLALMLDAYNRKLIEFAVIPKMMSERPSRIANLEKNGNIAVGMNADFTLVNSKHEWVVKGEELETKCKWSPFEGRKLKGKNVKTIINGKLVYDAENQ